MRMHVTRAEFAQQVAGTLALGLAHRTWPDGSHTWTINSEPATRHQVMELLAEHAAQAQARGHFEGRTLFRIQYWLDYRETGAYDILNRVAQAQQGASGGP